jgi:hypothetical protein
MQSKTEPVCNKNELIMNFKDLTYRKSDDEMVIQQLQGAKDWLKYINYGHSHNSKLEIIIDLLDTHIDNLLKALTTNNNELFELEIQLLELYQGITFKEGV